MLFVMGRKHGEISLTRIYSRYSFSFYRLPDGKRVELDNDSLAIAARETKQYTDNYRYKKSTTSNNDSAEIIIVNGDCLDVARHFKKKYPESNPVVLNMANADTPGGGWRNGS